MKLPRRALLRTGLTGLTWAAMHGLSAASNTPTRFVFHVSGAGGDPVDKGCAPIITELEKRGFPSMLLHSTVKGSDTVGFYEVCPLKALPKVKQRVCFGLG